MLDTIDPSRQYPLREAAAIVSAIRGPCSIVALRARIRRGCYQIVKGPKPGDLVYLPGSELLRLLGADQMPEWHGRTAAESRKAGLAAMERLRKMGVKC